MGTSISVDRDNFDSEVIQKSYEKPVLVDFFATWCGPCQMLKPMLEKLVQEYDFVLAKVDIDQNPDLAHTYRVEGVPDVKIVVNGNVSDGFVGVLPEPQLRELLAQLNLKSFLDQSLETIYTEASQGHIETAQALLTKLLQEYPNDRSLTLEAANFYIEADQLDKAEQLLATIPEYEKPFFSQAQGLKVLINFKQVVAEPESTNLLKERFRAGAKATLAGDYGAALEQFLAIVSSDRKFQDDGARKAMLAIFDLLGADHPLTKDYRKKLTQALY